jgi:hypothetical protein
MIKKVAFATFFLSFYSYKYSIMLNNNSLISLFIEQSGAFIGVKRYTFYLLQK